MPSTASKDSLTQFKLLDNRRSRIVRKIELTLNNIEGDLSQLVSTKIENDFSLFENIKR